MVEIFVKLIYNIVTRGIVMFLGEYKHQLDEKSRFRIPTSLKKELGSEYVITKGMNGCLFVFSKNNLQKQFEEKLNNISLFDETAQRPLRLLFSSAFYVEEDNQGRVLMPKALREFAGLEKNIVFLGVGSHIEIWSEDNLEEYIKTNESFDSVLQGLKEYGI